MQKKDSCVYEPGYEQKVAELLSAMPPLLIMIVDTCNFPTMRTGGIKEEQGRKKSARAKKKNWRRSAKHKRFSRRIKTRSAPLDNSSQYYVRVVYL